MVSKQLRLSLALILIIACFVTCGSLSAFAAEAWERTCIEQYDAAMPLIDLYVYPTNKTGEAIFGLTDNLDTIHASLNDEVMEVTAFESAQSAGCSYIFLVNIASNGSGNHYLQEIKAELIKWLEDMNPNDSVKLIAYAGKPLILLDGSESRAAAELIIDNIKIEVENADTVSAIKEGIRLAQAEKDLQQRSVMIMYDNGQFLTCDEGIRNELSKSLIAEGLPLYSICNYPYKSLQKEMDKFAEETGGKNFNSKSNASDSATEILRNWLKGCYILSLRGENNFVNPRERTLAITFGENNSERDINEVIVIGGSIADNESPVADSVNIGKDLNKIDIVFSEKISVTDTDNCFSVSNKIDGTEIDIASLEVDENDKKLTLCFDEPLKDGEYCLNMVGITDCSQEANAACFPDGTGNYEFIIGDPYSVESSDDTVNDDSALESLIKKLFPDGLTSEQLIIICIAGIVLIVLAVIISKKVRKRKKSLPSPHEGNTAVNNGQILANGNELRAEMRVIYKNGLKNTLNFTIKNNEQYIVGRNEKKCNFVIKDDPTLSNVHMIISNINGRLVVSDADTTNGTFINKTKIGAPYPLRNGDQIRIGETNIQIQY